jgi:predicted kinase
MTDLFTEFVPTESDWTLDWLGIDDAFAWVRTCAGVPQDPIFHAEGDVWVHTRMVCEALVENQAWRALPAPRRALVFWAALLHDVAKPACTKVEADGRVTSRGHSKRGQIMARKILWHLGVAPEDRELICHMVTHHQVPFFLLERDNPQRLAFAISLRTECRSLALLTEADARGRECADQARLLENIELFREYCRDNDCYERPRQFPSDHSRFLYFRKLDRSPGYLAFDDTRSRVTLMSGLPAAGKDAWIASNCSGAKVVSLDALRDKHGVDPKDTQGRVVAAAREEARSALRAGENFVWNATNLSRQIRKQCIDLFADYNAHIRIVYVETTRTELAKRNQSRPSPVPDKAIERMLERWECPDLTECHELSFVTT